MKNSINDPITPAVEALGNFVDDLFHKSIHDFIGGQVFQSNSPGINIAENEKEYTLELAAPGMEKKDFKISLDRGQLVISSEKKLEGETTKENYTRREFNYSNFKRSYRLPENANTNAISAQYENGILKIQIEKLAPTKPESKNIDIQ
ncbi:MAG: Hsp20/alpha crystallin family protein [Bacteroidota bacterium]|nr:Hsp20/alpha crystallin family protein [Bacteroidota bacterium]